MLKPNLNILNDFFGIDPYMATQYHRANERRMSYLKPSFKRVIREVEKKYKVKLTGFSYIRQHDLVSHTTKVADRQRNQTYYICLMMGNMLYLEGFNPYNFYDESSYSISGLASSVITITSAVLRDIFQYIPITSYEMEDGQCCIEKEVFLAGVQSYREQPPKKPEKKKRKS